MRASEILKQTGRSIAYRPALAKLFGGVTAEIFFEQIFYWQDKAENQELGVYKTQAELEEETGLSRKEQETARKKLREIGVLIETHKRLEHRIYFKIDMEKLDEVLSTLADVQSEHSRMPESDIREEPKCTFVNTLDYNTRLHTNTPLTPQGESASADDVPVAENKKQRSLNIDYVGIGKAYNECVMESGKNLPMLADPENLSQERKRKIKKLADVMKKRFGSCDAETFRNYFLDFMRSARQFYFGENDRGWRADFEYILREKVMDKTIEGSL
ncbi:DNA replication protein [Pasteurella multocida]|uniref:DNA replication protein n=3 Tax=Pasteurella multocida TaxID=747 RepID=UPI00187ABF8A|nr:DNA replication protein [Pasteurella multocida]MBE7395142.1 DNA replication protein [Pasteurella multocida]